MQALCNRLGDLPRAAARQFGLREAVALEATRLSFEALSARVDDVARGLMAAGVQSGDRILIFVPNCIQWLLAFYAVASVGAVAVPVNTRFRRNDLAYLVEQSGASTLIVSDQVPGIDAPAMVREILALQDKNTLPGQAFPALRLLISTSDQAERPALAWPQLIEMGQAITSQALDARRQAVAPGDPALILYTSGTTGAPKGAVHSHAMLRTVADGANRLGITSRDVMLLFMPLFHSMGLYLAGMMFLVSGARLVLSARFDAGIELERIERERVSVTFGFDTHFHDLLAHREFSERDRSSLRIAMVPAGSPGAEPIARRVNRELCRSFSGYGSSECGTGIALSFLDASEDERCLGSGFPMPGYEYRVCDPATDAELPPNTLGELRVRGYGVMLEYFGNPVQTQAAFDCDGFFKTGDSALIDEAGFLRYVGRYKDMLKVGGENVDPAEVEAFLCQIPGLESARVTGLPDTRLGEAPVVCVLEGSHAPDLDAIRQHCSGRIASFKIPRVVVRIPAFPMTVTGKLQRAELRRLAQEQTRATTNPA
jgi:fatty-acyl-CoA synthase